MIEMRFFRLCALFTLLVGGIAEVSSPRQTVVNLIESGDSANALRYMESIVNSGAPLEDGKLPSMYFYAGMAHQMLADLEAAVQAYGMAIKHHYLDLQAWLNLGDSLLYMFKSSKAIAAFREATRISKASPSTKHLVTGSKAKLHRALSWSASWGKEYDLLGLQLKNAMDVWHRKTFKTGNAPHSAKKPKSQHKSVESDQHPSRKEAPVMPSDFGDLPPHVLKALMPLLPQSDPWTPSPPLMHSGRSPFLSQRRFEAEESNLDKVESSSRRPADVAAAEKSTRTKGHNSKLEQAGRRPLHVGLLSSDFGVHPVSSLIRGLVQALASAHFSKPTTAGSHLDMKNESEDIRAITRGHKGRRAVEVSCWLLSEEDSWWRRNMSAMLPRARFVSLQNLPHKESASKIKAAGVDILIDLNGHTRGSGLPLLKYRPAPVQVSWLGYPLTTGAPFVDYWLGDTKVIGEPSLAAAAFSERLLLLPPGVSYMSNDHASLLGHALLRQSGYEEQSGANATSMATKERLATLDAVENERRVRREVTGFQDILRTQWKEAMELGSSSSGSNRGDEGPLIRDSDGSLLSTMVILASFSNFMKMDPSIVSVWASILRRCPKAVLWLQEYDLHEFALPNIISELNAHGVDGTSRLLHTPNQPWVHHVTYKAAADLVLDTPRKNGHTTSMDALWGGVPIVTLAVGTRAEQRAGVSLLSAIGGPLESVGEAFSLKQYEDTVVSLVEDPSKLTNLRNALANRRTDCGGLYDSRAFSADFLSTLHSAVEASEATNEEASFSTERGGDKKEGATDNRNKPSKVFQVWQSQRSTTASIQQDCYQHASRNSPTLLGGSPRQLHTYSALESAQGSDVRDEEKRQGGAGSNNPTSPSTSSRRSSGQPSSYKASEGKPLLLHMGGWVSRPGWLTVNISPQPDVALGASSSDNPPVDIVAPMDDLFMFEASSVTAIYASHVLEHASYGQPRDERGGKSKNIRNDDDDDEEHSEWHSRGEFEETTAARRARLGLFANGEVAAALEEWARVLLPGGALFLAVPNLDALAGLYVNASLSPTDKVFVMRMLYGGQVDDHDFHKVGFDEALLAQLLHACGFCEVRRVSSFSLFTDTSEKEYKGVPISLNVAATACKGTPDGKPMSEENRIFVNLPGQ